MNETKLLLINKQEKTNKNKLIYIEIMRILAIFFVIFNHTKENGFCMFVSENPEEIQFWIYLIPSVFCKFSVAIFFAISGAFILAKEDEPIKKVWKDRVLKIIVVLILISSVYYIRNNGTNVQIDKFLISIYSSNVRVHLWYLYAYIAFLISSPFLRAMVKNLDNKYFYYMIGIFLVFNAIVPIAEYLISYGKYKMNTNLTVSWLIEKIVFYPCIGYFLHNRIKLKNPKKWISIMWLVNIIGILISCYMTYYKGHITGEFSAKTSQTFHECFTFINCISIFITIKYLFEKVEITNKYIRNIIFSIGSCTFGIYLIHLMIMESEPMVNLFNIMRNTKINNMIVAFVWCSLVMLVCYVITYVLKKIPIINKLL
ncbi:MAG: acyltransferase [Clostridia bacterium]|nr:acyltransferase [Clostridia bacterium]